ncbi:hypothetical protein [Streptomyces sp. NPDC051452]|uniref:hypothetical protein n=1 Tax=Streptomyces sp. NPDC051452 TaxID=3365654 RepID=UPI0037880C5F
MPSSPVRVHVSLRRTCPACGDAQCADPAECLYFLTSRPWADCGICAGSGFAGDYSPLDVYCPICGGSGLAEYASGGITSEETSDNAKGRHAAQIARLSALVSRTRLEVAA